MIRYLTNMKKFDHTFIIAVDGVDGAGKSTFIQNLKNKLEEDLDTDKVDITVQHFPNYDIESGEEIKKLLMTCKDASDPSFISSMTDLNMLNRYQTICDYAPDANKEFHIILFDRYKSSNDFFNIMKYKYNANGGIKNRDEYKDILMAHLNEMYAYCTPEPDLQIFATIDEGLQMERLSKKKNKDTFEIAANIRFVNKLFSKYIKLRLPLKYHGDTFYPLFFEKYDEKQLSMESRLSERCKIDEKQKSIHYYDPESQSDTEYPFKGKEEFFPFINREFSKFLHANILTLPMELFDEEYIENNYESLINKYPYLVRCKMACIPAFIAANDNKAISIKKCKTKCIPRMIMDRVVDIITFNILNQ